MTKLLDVLPINNQDKAVPILWNNIENEMGTALPTDYKWFAQTYGGGEIGRFFKIWVPNTEVIYLNLAHQNQKFLNGLRYSRKDLIEEVPNIQFKFNLYPEDAGLFPFGRSINGDSFYWETQGHPDKWNVIIQQVRSEDYERFDMPITEFLYELMRGSIETFMEDQLDKNAGFIPIKNT